jgi:hypothetical protein
MFCTPVVTKSIMTVFFMVVSTFVNSMFTGSQITLQSLNKYVYGGGKSLQIGDEICWGYIKDNSSHENDETDGIKFYQGMLPTRKGIVVAAYDFWKSNKRYPLAEDIHSSYAKLTQNSKLFKLISLQSLKCYLVELTTYHILEPVEPKPDQLIGRIGKRGKKPYAYRVNIDEEVFEEYIYNNLKTRRKM